MKKSAFTFIVCIIMITYLCVEFHNTEKNLSDNLLRMHIIANSDSITDQYLKFKVRDNILNEMGNELSSYSNAVYAKYDISKKLGKIKSIAEKTLLDEGITESVTVSIENTFFPSKSYQDITLPKGNYDALRVEIGEAKGQNWWCVMFPPLCFADCATGEIKKEDKEKLKTNLDKKDSELITSEKDSVKVRFKLYEIWQDGKEILNSLLN